MNQAAAQYPTYFSGFSQEGKIFAQDYNGQQQIGVTMPTHNDLKKQYDDLLEVAESYKARLIELKEIEIPLTPEQIAQKQDERLDRLQDIVAGLASQVQNLIGAAHEHNVNTSGCCRHQQGDVRDDDAGIPDSPGNPKNKGRPVAVHKRK